MGVSEEQRGLLGSSGLIWWRRRYFLLGEHKCFQTWGSQGKFCSHAFSPPPTALLNEQHHWCLNASCEPCDIPTCWRINCSSVIFFVISHSISTESKSRTWVSLSSLWQETVLRGKAFPLENPMFSDILAKDYSCCCPLCCLYSMDFPDLPWIHVYRDSISTWCLGDIQHLISPKS